MTSSNWDVLMTTRELDDIRDQVYAEGYKAGRIAALREVGCVKFGSNPHWCDDVWPGNPNQWCTRCRLLAEAESGEDTGEV